MKKSLIRLLTIAAIGLFLTACGSIHQYDYKQEIVDTKVKLNTASILSEEELYDRAKEEMTTSELHFYSTTSIAEDAAKNFMDKYPELEGKIIFHELDDENEYPQLIKELELYKNDKNRIDVLLAHSDLTTLLSEKNLVYHYFPVESSTQVLEEYQIPTAFMFSATLFMQDTSKGEAPIRNIWELTEEKWHGRILMKDPRTEQVNEDFLIMLTNPEYTDEIKKSYKKYYGTEWKKSEYDRIAYEWIAKFLANCDFSYESNSDIMKALPERTDNPIALVGYGKIRKLSEEDQANVYPIADLNTIDGFSGFAFGTYATVLHNTDNPYTSALFINYLLSAEGFCSNGSWNNFQGYYSTNNTVIKDSSTKDHSFSYWENILVIEDPDYILVQNNELLDFINSAINKAVE